VKRTQPLAWLKSGPGRDRPGEPGWTERHEVVGRPEEPLTFTFDIVKASGGMLPPIMRPDWKGPPGGHATDDEA
jgi:hypothetical protein